MADGTDARLSGPHWLPSASIGGAILAYLTLLSPQSELPRYMAGIEQRLMAIEVGQGHNSQRLAQLPPPDLLARVAALEVAIAALRDEVRASREAR